MRESVQLSQRADTTSEVVLSIKAMEGLPVRAEALT
jgi:hypothetical protein